MNGVSGSKGEANFVWRCKNCKVSFLCTKQRGFACLTNPLLQRESSATIQTAPTAYEQADPPKPKNIIVMDCRGLEFMDFRPDVSCLEKG